MCANFESNGLGLQDCTVAMILNTIFIELGTAVKADRLILTILSFHQVASTHINVYAKFESNGPRRLSCRTLTRMCTMALILRNIFIEIGTAV